MSKKTENNQTFVDHEKIGIFSFNVGYPFLNG